MSVLYMVDVPCLLAKQLEDESLDWASLKILYGHQRDCLVQLGLPTSFEFAKDCGQLPPSVSGLHSEWNERHAIGKNDTWKPARPLLCDSNAHHCRRRYDTSRGT